MNTQISNELNYFKSCFKEYWLIFLGLIVLYVPTYSSLINTTWRSEDQAHGPIILIVILYLLWVDRDRLFRTTPSKPRNFLGWILLLIGLLAYVLGRSQDVVPLDVVSQVIVFAGIILLSKGFQGLKALWFPLFFLLFMVPLPGVFLDAITLPMKIAVSYVAETILYWAEFPISRSGVILQIGQYQLLVADACAGLHTLISLEALGLLYLNIVKHDSLARNVILALLIVPISFTANVIRVIILTLITYYFGDAAGQGFVHGFAGLLLFVVALTLIISVDSLLQFAITKIKGKDSILGYADATR